MMSNVRWRAPAWGVFATRHEAQGALADDLPLTVTTDQMGPARILHLTIGKGRVSVAVALGKMPDATFSVPSAGDGVACLDALAAWLGVAVPPPHPRAVAIPPPITVGVIDMGKGKGGRAMWQLVQLLFAYDARLYVIWRVAGTEAFLCEHESGDRESLIRELAFVLRDGVKPGRLTSQPPHDYFMFDGEQTNVVAKSWAQKLSLDVAEVRQRLEAAGRAHVDPLYAQIDTALDAWPDDPHAAAIRTMKLPVHGCTGAVWGAIVHRGAAALSTDEVAVLRHKLRSLAARDFVQRLHHQDEVQALLLR
jgi:hypothetical protein